MNSPLVFLSGAGLPSWVWDEVRQDLSVDTVVPDYPRRRDATLADYSDAVLAQMSWPEFTLVAHSIGGVVASAVVAAAPERVAGFLAVSASVPEPGQSFLSALPAPQGLFTGLVVRLLGTRPPDKVLRRGLASGLEPAMADRIVAEFDPESKALYRDRVPPRTFPDHRGYLVTTEDKEFPLALQERFSARLGGSWRRSVATGHLPMLEDPTGVAKVVREFTEVQAS